MFPKLLKLFLLMCFFKVVICVPFAYSKKFVSELDDVHNIRFEKDPDWDVCRLIFPENFGVNNDVELNFLTEILKEAGDYTHDLNCNVILEYDVLHYLLKLAIENQDVNAAKFLLAGEFPRDGELGEEYAGDYQINILNKYNDLSQVLNSELMQDLPRQICPWFSNQMNEMGQAKDLIEDLRADGFDAFAFEIAKSCNLSYWGRMEYSGKVRTSPALKSVGKNTYDANNMFDRKRSTAWCTSSDEIAPVFVDFEYTKEREFKGIGFVNGYAKSSQVFKANSRIKSLGLSIDGTEVFDGDLLDDADLQWAHFDKIVGRKMHLSIDSSVNGEKYKDLCITEIFDDENVVEIIDKMEIAKKALMKKDLDKVEDQLERINSFLLDEKSRDSFWDALHYSISDYSEESLRFVLHLYENNLYELSSIHFKNTHLFAILMEYFIANPETVAKVYKTTTSEAMTVLEHTYYFNLEQAVNIKEFEDKYSRIIALDQTE